MDFGAISLFRPGMRYLLVKYQPEMRAKLAQAKGETGWATELAIPDELEPQAISQFYPSSQEGYWYFAMMKAQEKAISALSKEQFGQEIRQFLVAVRKQYFAEQLDGALCYKKSAPGVFPSNPYCRAVQVGNFDRSAVRYNDRDESYWLTLNEANFAKACGVEFPTPVEFIQDGQLGYTLRPVAKPETASQIRERAMRNGAENDPGARQSVGQIEARIGYWEGKRAGAVSLFLRESVDEADQELVALREDLEAAKQRDVRQVQFAFGFQPITAQQDMIQRRFWPPTPEKKSAKKAPAVAAFPAPATRMIRFEDEDEDNE